MCDFLCDYVCVFELCDVKIVVFFDVFLKVYFDFDVCVCCCVCLICFFFVCEFGVCVIVFYGFVWVWKCVDCECVVDVYGIEDGELWYCDVWDSVC